MILVWNVILSCFITGNCITLTQKTPSLVKVREGDTLTLEAEVDTDELNLRFTGPGNRVIGAHDHQATGEYQLLNETDTGFLLRAWLTIRPIDRFRSGRYALTAFDAYGWQQCNWTVVVQVVPALHISMPFPPTIEINADNDELRCGTYTEPTDEHVYCEFLGCNVAVRGADDIILAQFDQCDGLDELALNEKRELLYEAAKRGDVQRVSMLLMLGTTLTTGRFRAADESPLCIAARMGHMLAAYLILNAGAPLSYPSTYTEDPFEYEYIVPTALPSQPITALDCAAWSGSVPLVEMILAREAESLTKNITIHREGGSPILFAAKSGSLTLVKKLLSLGEKWNHTDTKGRTPIFFAALSGSIQLVKFFKDLGADMFATDDVGKSLLFYAARSGSLQLVELLVSTGLQPLQANSLGETPIVDAVLGGSVPVLEAFLEWGGVLNFTDKEGRSLMHLAVAMGHEAMIEKLRKIGFDFRVTDRDYNTPLHYVVRYGHPSLIAKLISLSGNPDIREKYGRTPLYDAAYFRDPFSVEELLIAGANVSTFDHNGNTALHSVSANVPYIFVNWFRDTENLPQNNTKSTQIDMPRHDTWYSRHRTVLALLVKAGANPKATNNRGWTPLHNLVRRSELCNRVNVELLVKAGGSLNARDEKDQTPLHMAASSSDLSCVQILVEAGATTEVVNRYRETPLDVARGRSGGEEIAEYLAALKKSRSL